MGAKFDFSGWATKNDIRCSDGRTIRKNAFKECDGAKVPLVWNHQHNSPENVLGHAILENREDGVYAYCFLNNTESGHRAKEFVEHGDIDQLSIYANRLKQVGGDVIHGVIREVSMVLAGANPEAKIDIGVISHSDDDSEEFDAIIYTGEEAECLGGYMEHAEENGKDENMKNEEIKKSSNSEEKTVEEVFNTLTDEQKNAVYAIVGAIFEENDEEDNKEAKHSDEGDNDMKFNVFDRSTEPKNDEVLSHAEMTQILEDGQRLGSLKEAVLQHSITDIGYLFPDAQNVRNTPDMIQRDMEWVNAVMNGATHTPFSRIRSRAANITADEARAKGFVKSNQKAEEVITLLKRETDPQTIYKLQAMHRDDLIDITDFNVVAWLKSEMQMMLREEVARAALVGDGRSSASNDKIKEDKIRPIWTDDSIYTVKAPVTFAATDTTESKAKKFIKAAVRARKYYKGSGNPVLFTTEDLLTDCLLIEDLNGRVIYDSVEKLKNALRVSAIHTVPVMENQTRTDTDSVTWTLLGIIVNMKDYSFGADKGGSMTMFDDFDILYNKERYLIETRLSGALTLPYSAIALEGKTETEEEEEEEDDSAL